MLILDLCGGTGAWSRPYAEAGYRVVLVDLLTTGDDVRLWEGPERAHGVLAAPPCTDLASSGARWWSDKGPDRLRDALSVVDACVRIIWRLKPLWWALENPVGRLTRYLGPPVATFDPCDYGDPYTKRTLLWGQFVMPPKRTVEPTEGSKMHLLPPSPDRWRLRSETPPGFARAFYKANP